jgi:hypothetical protein
VANPVAALLFKVIQQIFVVVVDIFMIKIVSTGKPSFEYKREVRRTLEQNF